MREDRHSAAGATPRFPVLMLLWLFVACAGSTEPAAARLEAVTATELVGTVDSPVLPAPVVRVTDSSGEPIPGVEVFFELAGGGTVTHRSERSGTDGQATVGSWTLGTVARPHTITARSAGLAPVIFTALAAPGPVRLVEVLDGDHQLANAGEVLPEPLRVLVADGYRNSVQGAPVTFSILSGGGTLAGGIALTDAAGVATSGSWTLGPVGGTQRVRAQAAGYEAVFTAIGCDESCRRLQLLYVRDGNIFRTNLGGATTQLTFSGRDWLPAWSPDGSRIAFHRHDAEDSRSIYLMDADGSNIVRLARDFHSPSWSSDGHRLAVAKGDCVYTCSIFLLSADDSSVAPIGIAGMAASPAWSPDGSRIAFVSLSGDDGHSELRVMRADGAQVTVLSPRDAAHIGRPSWSPDGTRVAFAKCLGGRCDVHVAFADGTGVTPLTSVGNASDPAWSPDGTHLALSLFRHEGGEWDASIAVIESEDSGEPIPIIPHGTNPAWVPLPASGIVALSSAHRDAAARTRR